MFASLVLLSALLIEGIGTFISVLGLAALFSSSPLILAMAIALDVGKVVAVSFVYKFWGEINLLMKTYMVVAIIVLMTITSAGVFGFLSAEFQKAISGTSAQTVLISSLEEEKQRLQLRKQEIDSQIAKLPENFVRGRTTLMQQFAPEVGRINSRLAEIDKDLPQLKMEAIKKNVEVGPIIYIAEAFNTTPEQAVKWVILVIIFVFDPLAVALLIAGNFLLKRSENLIPVAAVVQENVQAPEEKAQEPPQEIKREDPPPETTAPQLEEEVKPEPEPISEVIESPPVKIDDSEADVITINHVNKFVKPSKSSLEDIDATRVDVQFGDDAMKNFRNLGSIYSER